MNFQTFKYIILTLKLVFVLLIVLLQPSVEVIFIFVFLLILISFIVFCCLLVKNENQLEDDQSEISEFTKPEARVVVSSQSPPQPPAKTQQLCQQYHQVGPLRSLTQIQNFRNGINYSKNAIFIMDRSDTAKDNDNDSSKFSSTEDVNLPNNSTEKATGTSTDSQPEVQVHMDALFFNERETSNVSTDGNNENDQQKVSLSPSPSLENSYSNLPVYDEETQTYR